MDHGRVSIKAAVYGQFIRTAQDVVQDSGDSFAALPVAVYIHSEGIPKRVSSENFNSSGGCSQERVRG